MLEDSLGFEILKEVSRVSNSIQDLEATLDQIIEVTKNETKIDACAIFLLDEDGIYLRFQASSGVGSERAKHIKLKMGEGITGWVAQHKTSLALRDALNDPRAYHFPQVVEEKFQSMLSVPIIFDDQCIGVINVGSCIERVFSKREISILETIANQVSGCIRNALLFQKTQELLKEQTILYDISRAVQTTLNMEQGLWIILSGITMGEAGGFNRAILFMADEAENHLEGLMGLGPDSPEDAHRIWTGIGKFEGSLLQWVIEADKDAYKRSTFNAFARSLKFPLRGGSCILAETFVQKKPCNMVDAAKDPRVSREFMELLGVNAFAAVPLVVHEKALGVILADNRYNDKAITDADLRLLERFATHASWVIENTRLFTQLRQTNRDLLETKEQLNQSEKLAALGELSAEVAHEIKNPLVSIGGFARRLQDKISKFVVDEKYSVDYQTTLKYSQIILGEVERLEALLKNILLYSTTSELRKEDCPINLLLMEVIQLFYTEFNEKNIQIHSQLDDNVGILLLDHQKLKQVVINLFHNALESMPEGGKLMVETYREKDSQDRELVTIRIEDTGGGIAQEVYLNVFNPFFTTKGSGTGLGLPICRKIVASLGGTIRLENQIGKGVTVFIQLPT